MSSTTTHSTYRYEHFELRHMLADMRFAPGTPAPGDRLPYLDLETTEGERITIAGMDRPHLFVFGSNTCPMTASAGGVLEGLHRRFGEAVHFVLVQVREAHPGDYLTQPDDFATKVAHASRLRDDLGVSFTVAVDDLEGSFHTSLDPKPNAAYLVEADGTIVFRSMWSSDEVGMSAALAAVASGRAPERRESTRKLRPMLASIGFIDQVLRNAGPRASRDLLRAAPPMLVGARLAARFGSLPPERRGPALLAVSVAAAAATAVLVILLS
jgi:hypothetical protein